MISFALACAEGHRFDGWFRSSADYEAQAERSAIACPVCGGTQVTKALMAPNVATSRKKASAPAAAQPVAAASPSDPRAVKLRAMAAELRAHIEANFDHVGRQFPEEARKIHYGETEPRAIYGEATGEEAKALAEEGVEVSPAPWARREDA